MTVRRIRMSADYGCHPLWWDTVGGPSSDGLEAGDIDPGTLPLAPSTRERLARWAAMFDAWQPESSDEPGPSSEELRAFEREGVELWKEVRRELTGFVVVYKSVHGPLVTDPAQVPFPGEKPVPPGSVG